MLLLATSILLSALAYAGSSWLARRHLRSVSGFTAKMLTLLLITPLLMLLPKWQIDLIPQQQSPASVATGSLPSAFNLELISLCIWLVGGAVLFIRLLTHHFAIKRWLNAADPFTDLDSGSQLLRQVCQQIQLKNPPTVVACHYVKSPVVTGLFRPTILLPLCAARWSENTLSMVLLHECTHIKRKDLWLSTAAQICCAFYWFNPLVWLLHRRLRSACEFACDAEIIAYGANAHHYIHALCDVAESVIGSPQVPTSALAMADSSSLRSRVSHLLENPPQSRPFLMIFLLAFSVCGCMAIAIIRPTSPPASDHLPYSAQEIELRHTADPFPAD